MCDDVILSGFQEEKIIKEKIWLIKGEAMKRRCENIYRNRF